MTASMRSVVFLGILASGSLPAAAAERMCTKMGCTDNLRVVLRTANGQPATDVEIELAIDGRAVVCKPTPPGSQNGPFQCAGEVTLLHEEIQRCRGGNCQGTGKFEQTIEIPERPKRVRVQIKQAERVLAKKSFVGHYTRVRPNGPHCPPICRQSKQTWRYK